MSKKLKPRDKITQKMSRDGLIEVNETAGTVEPLPKNGSSTMPPLGQPAKMQVSASFGGNAAKCPPL